MSLPGYNDNKPTVPGEYPPLQHYFHPEHNNKHLFSYPPPPPLIIPHPFDRDISPPRKRTRTTPEQLAVLEKSFSINPSPNNRVREQLALQLGMPERSIQIWFQNRRAKVKNQAKRNIQMKDHTMHMQQQYAASAAAAACQAAAVQQNQESIDPNLYYYYYYYYFHQQQQQSPIDMHPTPSTSYSTPISWTPAVNTAMPDLTLSASTSSSSITSDNHRRRHNRSSSASSGERTRAHSVGPYYRKSTPHERQSSMGPPPTTSFSNPVSGSSSSSTSMLYPTILEETFHIAPSVNMQQKLFKLSAQGLQIGTWKRVSDLDCHIDLSTRTLVWCISSGPQQKFRMDISINLVQYIRVLANRIEFFLSSPHQIKFFMTVQGEWVQCHDFTQDKQAMLENVHVLQGEVLQSEFMEILMQAPDLQSLVMLEETEKDMDTNLLLLQGLHLPQQ